jgi:hypothetical protein
MRVVKTYETFFEKKFDINFAIAKIKHLYTEYDVKNLVDEEIEELVDDSSLSDVTLSSKRLGREEEYETKREWYNDHGNGEAEELAAERLVDIYESEFGEELTEDDKNALSRALLDEKSGYDSLQH